MFIFTALRTYSRIYTFVFAAFFLGFLAATASLAVENVAENPGAEATRIPIVIYAHDPTSLRPGGPADKLLQRAREQGQVLVIIGLNITCAWNIAYRRLKSNHKEPCYAKCKME